VDIACCCDRNSVYCFMINPSPTLLNPKRGKSEMPGEIPLLVFLIVPIIVWYGLFMHSHRSSAYLYFNHLQSLQKMSLNKDLRHEDFISFPLFCVSLSLFVEFVEFVAI
jgi:hypothetical protein